MVGAAQIRLPPSPRPHLPAVCVPGPWMGPRVRGTALNAVAVKVVEGGRDWVAATVMQRPDGDALGFPRGCMRVAFLTMLHSLGRLGPFSLRKLPATLYVKPEKHSCDL